MSFSLYKLSNDFQQAINDAYQCEELSLAQIDVLNNLTGDIEDKAINIAAFIKNLEAESEAVKSAAKQMADRAKSIDNKIESLTNYLKHNLESCKIDEISKSPYFKIKIKSNPASVVVEDENKIPMEFKKIKETISIDKILLKEALKNGNSIPGAILCASTRLEIK